MKTVQIIVATLISVIILLWACAPETAPAPQAPAPVAAPAPAPVAAPAPAAKATWEVEWDRVLEAAKREGVVAFAISAGRDPQVAFSAAFKDKFGIRSESIAGTAGTITSKILAERRAGLYTWDVMIAGASAQTSVFKPGGGTAPLEPALILPDLTDPEEIKKVWFGGKLPWVDKDRHMLAPLQYTFIAIAINTTLVRPGEIKAFDDLLDPKWKGKILLMNPTLPGTNCDGTLMLMFYEVKGEAWVRKLAAQEPVIIGDDRLAMDWLAHGKYPVYMPPRGETFKAFTTAGAPIATIETQDVAALDSGPAGVALIDRAPHPNATKLFINFLLSKEGQTVFTKARLDPSARLDVPTEGLPSWSLVKPGRNYWVKTREEVLLKVADYRVKSKEIFGHLIK